MCLNMFLKILSHLTMNQDAIMRQKIAKLQPPLIISSRTDPKTTYLFYFCLQCLKLLRNQYVTNYNYNLKENVLLSKYRSGFTANFSIDSCLVQLNDFVLSGMDEGMHTGVILADLWNAFDTLELVSKYQQLNIFSLIYQIENSSLVNGSLLTRYQFVLGKIKQNTFFFLN